MTRLNPKLAALRCLVSAVTIAVFLACTLTVMSPTTCRAQNEGSFTLKIAEKEMKLEHPSDMMWDKYVMWDLPFQRMNDRNMPYLELANDVTSDAPIKEFHLTIGDTRFNFAQDVMGKYAMLGSTTPGFDISATTVGGMGDELVVTIGNGGLQPGDLLRLKIDLAVDPAYAGSFFAFPDYRTVLFDMNGFNVYDGLQQQSDSDNARAWVVFDPPVGADFTTQPVALHDEIVSGAAADFYNNNYRHYRDMDPVRAFLVTGGTTGEIPEPTSVFLIGIGVMAGGFWGRRPRVRTAARSL